MSSRAVFLDRDGVLNRESAEFIKTVDEIDILPGVPAAIAKLNAAGYRTVVITNQSGIGRGLFSEETLTEMHRKLESAVQEGGGVLTAIYHCPHLPGDGCSCRKPEPGMILRGAREYEIDLNSSYFVGDRPEDIRCGNTAGCRTILVLTGNTRSYDADRFQVLPDHVCADLTAAVDCIIGLE